MQIISSILVEWNSSFDSWRSDSNSISSLSQFSGYMRLFNFNVRNDNYLNVFISVDELWSAPIIMIVIGAIVFIIAFLGCCGAIKESSCMVLTVSVHSSSPNSSLTTSIYNEQNPFFLYVSSSPCCCSWSSYSKS